MSPASTGDPSPSLCRSSSGMDESELSWLASLHIAGSISSANAPPAIKQEEEKEEADFACCQSSTELSRPPRAPVVRMPSTLLSDLAAEMLSSTPTNPELLDGFPSLRRPDELVPSSAECADELPSLPLLQSRSSAAFGENHHSLIASELDGGEGDADGIVVPPAVSSSFSSCEILSPSGFRNFSIPLPQPRSRAMSYRSSDAGILPSGRLVSAAAAPELHSGVQRRASESAADSLRINQSTASVTPRLSFSFSSSPPVLPPWETNTIPVAPASAVKRTRKSPLKRKSHIQGVECHVKSCRADLRDSKPYNRRYNMCPDCMKAGSVLVDDNEMRWCQQCSCLHPLSEFRGEKRSCTEKMDKHKERRRARNKERRMEAKKGRAASQNSTVNSP